MKLWTTITGPFADACDSAINIPHTRATIIYERDIPIPRLWHNKQTGKWEPERFGSSIFDPKWSIAQLESWARTYSPPGDRPLILDIEDVHPWPDTMAVDAKENLYQIVEDSGKYRPGNGGDSLSVALRDLWTTMLVRLRARGYSVGCYGHPMRQATNWRSTDPDRRWFFDLLDRTHPCVYEWQADREPGLHAAYVVRPRIIASRSMMPLRPCWPFIYPFVDDGTNRPLGHKTLEATIGECRDLKCDGVVLWYHAKDTAALTRWMAVAPMLNGMLRD